MIKVLIVKNMAQVTQQELTDLIVEFANEEGLWQEWKNFVQLKGWNLDELNMEEED